MEKEEDIAAFKDYKPDDSAAGTPAKSADEPSAAAKKPEKKETPKKSEAPSTAEQTTKKDKPAASPSKDGRVFVSPLAKKLAEEKGIDLSVRNLTFAIYF